MYKVIPVPGGYQVFWVENEGATPRPVRVEPFKHRQSAHRKAKQLNDAVKEIDEMIAKDGAIIIG
jgi:hypothetical protein